MIRSAYTDYVEQKGYSLTEVKMDPRPNQVPDAFKDRYSTYEEYLEGLADFLNGM